MVAAIWTVMSSHEFSARPMALKDGRQGVVSACLTGSCYQWSMAVNEDSQEVMMLSNTFGSSAFFSSFTSILTFAQVELGFHLQRHRRLMQRPGQRQSFAALGFQDLCLIRSGAARQFLVWPGGDGKVSHKEFLHWLKKGNDLTQALRASILRNFSSPCPGRCRQKTLKQSTINRCYEPFSDGWLITFVVALPIL